MSEISWSIPEDVRARVLAEEFDYRKVTFGSVARKATLFTQLAIKDKSLSFRLPGYRLCRVSELRQRVLEPDFGGPHPHEVLAFDLEGEGTFFQAKETPAGPVTIFTDPRKASTGSLILRRGQRGGFELPGLNYFNQHLIFQVGGQFLVAAKPLQVVATVTAWPPENHQYHHLEEQTPIFDLNTGERVATKGISIITIEGPLSADERKGLDKARAEAVKLFEGQKGFKNPPAPLAEPA